MNFSRHFCGLATVTFVTATVVVRAQVGGTNSPMSPPLPRLDFKNVAPGVTLHQSSPVLYFRGILGMTPAERERALSSKSAAARTILLQKVEEYQKLPVDIREARLRQTQLRWELNSLVKLSLPEATSFIKEAPLEDRPLLEDYFHWQSLTASEARKDFLAKLSPDRHLALTQSLLEWEAVPESDRQEASGQFRQIVYLNPAQQKQTLDRFPEAERKTMQAALNRFASLTDAQRKICVESFQEFASMDPADRDDFLRNAARWEAMSADDRNLWRTLVQEYPIVPPSPPGLFNVVRYPPLPPGVMHTPPTPPGMNPAPTTIPSPKN